MTWPQQSPTLIPAQMVWDERNRAVTEEQPTSARRTPDVGEFKYLSGALSVT